MIVWNDELSYKLAMNEDSVFCMESLMYVYFIGATLWHFNEVDSQLQYMSSFL